MGDERKQEEILGASAVEISEVQNAEFAWDKKEMECHICAKIFKHKSSLSRHRKIHQQYHAFICGKCGKSFARKDSLLKHRRKIICDEVKETEWQCAHCSKRYTIKSSYVRHKKSHITSRANKTNINRAIDTVEEELEYPFEGGHSHVNHIPEFSDSDMDDDIVHESPLKGHVLGELFPGMI